MKPRPTARRVPPAPNVLAHLYAEYRKISRRVSVSFEDYLRIIGIIDPAERLEGTDSGSMSAALVAVPAVKVAGPVKVVVLLVDFEDNRAERPPEQFHDLLFSRGLLPTGSMADYYHEVSGGRVEISGEVHGWLRMPQTYDYYVAGASGLGSYPRNTQRLAEDAVNTALAGGVTFSRELDVLGSGAITALMIVHAGRGAEVITAVAGQKTRIWSHKGDLRLPVKVGGDLIAANYLVIPEDARVGVCAHELGHLVFQWDDFYDPNYDKDGKLWDGSGVWDLMAGGSWNAGGARPAHPAALHKVQHGWVNIVPVTKSVKNLVIPPIGSENACVVKLRSNAFTPPQQLLLENRSRKGFNDALPGEGLLVWRIDTDASHVDPALAAMMLIQADGQHELENGFDGNIGDAGDPFPSLAGMNYLRDTGDICTSFPGAQRSGIELTNIVKDANGEIRLDVTIA